MFKTMLSAGVIGVLAGCASAAEPRPARASGTDPCDMTVTEHRRAGSSEARAADAARWRTTTTKQGVLARQRDLRAAEDREIAAAQHFEAAREAHACR
jgi:hypothetical protein